MVGMIVGHIIYPEEKWIRIMRHDEADTWQVVYSELLETWLLCVIVLMCKYCPNRAAPTPHFPAIIIGITLAVLIKNGGWISGGAYNPAIGFSLVFLDPKFYDTETIGKQFVDLIIYQVVCGCSGILAYVWMRGLHLPLLAGLKE